MTTVLSAILAATNDARVRASMVLGALLEGGSLGAGPFPAGDNGSSLGPFQIHLPAHPGVSAAQAQDPAGATRFMLGEYTGAAARVPASLWSSNPERAAEQTAMLAERPARDYYASRPGAVQNAWPQVMSALSGKLPAAAEPPAAAAGADGTTAQNVGLPGIDVGTTVIRGIIIGLAVAGGVGLVVLGLNKATGNPAGKAARAGATIAPLAL